jgi:hypothetical protein
MKLRDSFHIFIGFAIMYLIGSITDFSEFTLDGKIIGVPLVSAVIGISIGFFWEWCQSVIIKSYFDFMDIARTAIGTLAGGLFSLWLPDMFWLMVSTSVVSILLVLNDMKYFLNKR